MPLLITNPTLPHHTNRYPSQLPFAHAKPQSHVRQNVRTGLVYLIAESADLRLGKTAALGSFNLRNFFTTQKRPKTLAKITHRDSIYEKYIDILYVLHILLLVMKSLTVPNIKSDRAQLARMTPSTAALRTFDGLSKKLGTSREEVARQLGTKGEYLFWAFTRGKSDSAEKLRKGALEKIDQLIEEQTEAVAA